MNPTFLHLLKTDPEACERWYDARVRAVVDLAPEGWQARFKACLWQCDQATRKEESPIIRLKYKIDRLSTLFNEFTGEDK